MILRADNASRLVNEYVRAFLRKYAPQHLAAKQMDLPLPDRYKPTPEQLIQNQLLDRGIKENVRLKSQCAASAFA